MTKFPNSKKALKEYDKMLPTFNAMADAVQTDADVYGLMIKEKVAVDKVREAYYQDTKDFNCRDNCMLCSIAFIREMAGE
jgi:hypothetical protein